MSAPPNQKPKHRSIILTKLEDAFGRILYRHGSVYNKNGAFTVTQCGYKVDWDRVICWWYLEEGK